jgi:hypothetical protein
MTARHLSRICKQTAKAAAIDKNVSMHTLRHSFAIHLLKAAAKTLLTIDADSKHLSARLGVTFVLHTWGSAMTHHPHVHGIVPGVGLSLDGEKWVSCKSGFFLPVRVLSHLFRRLYCEM